MVSEASSRSTFKAVEESSFHNFACGSLGVANDLRRVSTLLDPNRTHSLEVWTDINFGIASYYHWTSWDKSAEAITATKVLTVVIASAGDVNLEFVG